MAATEVILYRSDNVVELTNVRNRLTDLPLTNASVQVTMMDLRGVPVLGVEWPISLTHTENGNFVGTLPWSAEVVLYKDYKVTVVVNGGLGLRREAEIRVLVVP